MINKDELDKAILEHESKDTTYANCERLAWLYIVRDHITNYQAVQPTPLNIVGDSEFLKLVNNKNSAEVFTVINGLVEAVKSLHPRMYNRLIKELSEI